MSQSAKGNASQEVLATARRGRAAAAGEDALGAGKSALARAGFSDPALVLRWPEIAGAEVARIASPLKLQDDDSGAVLTLKCDPGAIVFLQHQTRALIERLNAYLGQDRIARVKFVRGQFDIALEPSPHPSPRRGEEKSRAESGKSKLSIALDRLAKVRALARNGRQTRPPD